MKIACRFFALGLCAIVLAGCAPQDKLCTEIGFTNTVIVNVVGDAPVDGLTWCVSGECSAETTFEARPLGDGAWVVETPMSTPPVITVAALDASGGSIATEDVSVEWVGTDEPNGPGCDNVSEAEPVTVTLP
ncbi:hypothetical protein [Microbacterium sp. P04]|uniref:hypothetical protein n=1 Tax=Microbacterium sp. P04 TaxID=3366947 RepID=UPI0037456749